MTQVEINTLAILRAFKLRIDTKGGKHTPGNVKRLNELESMPDKPASLPVSYTTWRDVKMILIRIDKLDKEDSILGQFDPDASWTEINGQMVRT